MHFVWILWKQVYSIIAFCVLGMQNISFKKQYLVLNSTQINFWILISLVNRQKVNNGCTQNIPINSIDVFPITRIKFQTFQHHFMSISNHIYWRCVKIWSACLSSAIFASLHILMENWLALLETISFFVENRKVYIGQLRKHD